MQRTISIFAYIARSSCALIGIASLSAAQATPPAGSSEPVPELGAVERQEERPYARWYVGASFGLVDASYSSSDLESALSDAGFAGVTADTDDSGIGYQLYGGYRVHPRVSVELGFVDLGSIDSTLTIPTGSDETGLLNTVEDVHDVSGYGALLAVKGSALQRDGFDVWGKVGGFFWWSDAEIDGLSQRRGFDDNGFDVMLGAGVTYRLADNWAVQGEVDGFRVDGEWIPFYSVGLQYLFLERRRVPEATPN